MTNRTQKMILTGIISGIIGVILAVYVYPKYTYYSSNAKFFMLIFSLIVLVLSVIFFISVYRSTFSTKMDLLFYKRLEENKLIKINSYAFFMLIIIIILIYSGLTFRRQTDYFRAVVSSVAFGLIVTVIQYYKGLKNLFRLQKKS